MNQTTQKIDYIPPRVLESILKVFEHGAEKHQAFGWKEVDPHGPKGIDHQIDKALGHIGKWEVIGEYDEDSGQSHLAHATTRLIIALDMILEEQNGPQRTEGTREGISQTSTVSEYIQKEVAEWKKKTGRD